MNSRNQIGKSAKIKAVILIVMGFLLIFSILTALILYTVYDRSLLDFIQGIGRAEASVSEPDPAPVNPALLSETTANTEYSDGLWILTDSIASGIKDQQISVRSRCFTTSFISTTNYMEALFQGSDSPEEAFTIAEFLTANTPKYLLINFSGTGLTLNAEATQKLYRAILELVFITSPETTVILSGPLPLNKKSDIVPQTAIDLDILLAELSGTWQTEGMDVYYLASPAAFFDSEKALKSDYTNENGVLNDLGCEVYFNYILRHPVPTDK